MQNILVFFGGRSAEHDISVITGVLTTNCLNKTKYNPIPVYVDNDGKWYSGEALVDIEFYKNKLIELTNSCGLSVGCAFLVFKEVF